MKKTRLSLYYLASYLLIGGFSMLFFPNFTLKLFLSNGDYGEIMPRLAGMFLVGIGLLISRIIQVGDDALYSVTLIVRGFFLICFLWLYYLSKDPLFLVFIAIVGLGFLITGSLFLSERKAS